MKNKFIEIIQNKRKRHNGNKEDTDILMGLCVEKFIQHHGIEAAGNLDIFEDRISLDDKEREILRNHVEFTFFNKIFEDFLMEKDKERTGSFYTPDFVINYMVYSSLIKYLSISTNLDENLIQDCLENKAALNFIDIHQMINALDNVKVIDIACGTGLFLINCLKRIYRIKESLYTLMGQSFDQYKGMKDIVENNLYGIDIQANPVKIAKMTLAAMVYDGGKSDPIKFNFFTGDALLDEDLYMDCLEDVFCEKNGFDIVLGNPPYMGEKGNKELFRKVKDSNFGKKYYEGKMDFFYFFIYKAMEILNNDGFLSYITTNYFVTADGAKKLRKHLKEKGVFLEIINFNHYEVFKSAKGQHNMIFFLKKGINHHDNVRIIYPKKNIRQKELENIFVHGTTDKKYVTEYCQSQKDLYDLKGNIVLQENDQYDRIIKKIVKYAHKRLQDICHVNQGIVSGGDKVTKGMLQSKFCKDSINRYRIELGQGIFVLGKEEALELGLLKSPCLKPMYKNSDIQRYVAKEVTNRYFLYITDELKIDSMENHPIISHLKKFKDVLDKRRETINGTRKWYALQWPRSQQIFEGEKIVVPHRARLNKFAYTCEPWYASADVYFITSKVHSLNKFFLLGQLNSKLMYFWLFNRGKRKGEDLELYANPLKELPIILNMDSHLIDEISHRVQYMIHKKQEDDVAQREIDHIIYRFYKLSEKEIEMVEQRFPKPKSISALNNTDTK